MSRAFPTYERAVAVARRDATQLGISHGIERIGREWIVRMIPRPENRYGCDARCEPVEPGSPLSVRDLAELAALNP